MGQIMKTAGGRIAGSRIAGSSLAALAIAATALAASWLVGPAPAQAQEVTLTLHHFLSPKSATHAKFLEPWAKAVEMDSGGRIKVQIFPSMTLGGKPPELFNQVRDGTVDLVWTLPGYTPGVFPRSEVFELPTVHYNSSLATTLAIQDNWALIAEDFKDVHPILIHTHSGNALHLRDKKMTTVADLKGLKLRTPSRSGGWMIEELGAEPVGMPVPALPEALSKGVVDGALVPFEIMPPLKLHELTKYSIELENGERFGTSVFMLIMNKQRYDALPDDLKAVIDANSGMAIAAGVGQTWLDIEQPGYRLQRESGGEVLTLDAAAKVDVDAAGKRVVERWIADAKGRGIDGAKLVEAARAAIATHTAK